MNTTTHADGRGRTRHYDCGCRAVTRGTELRATTRWYFCERHQESTARAIAEAMGMHPPREEPTHA